MIEPSDRSTVLLPEKAERNPINKQAYLQLPVHSANTTKHSVSGLCHEFNRCLSDWEQVRGTVPPFGSVDISCSELEVEQSLPERVQSEFKQVLAVSKELSKDNQNLAENSLNKRSQSSFLRQAQIQAVLQEHQHRFGDQEKRLQVAKLQSQLLIEAHKSAVSKESSGLKKENAQATKSQERPPERGFFHCLGQAPIERATSGAVQVQVFEQLTNSLESETKLGVTTTQVTNTNPTSVEAIFSVFDCPSILEDEEESEIFSVQMLLVGSTLFFKYSSKLSRLVGLIKQVYAGEHGRSLGFGEPPQALQVVDLADINDTRRELGNLEFKINFPYLFRHIQLSEPELLEIFEARTLDDLVLPNVQAMLLSRGEELSQAVEICDHVFSFSAMSLQQQPPPFTKIWQRTLARQYCEICDKEFAMALMASPDQDGEREFTLICEKCYSDLCAGEDGLEFVKYLGTTHNQFFSSRFR